ncbi:fimbrial protein [Serratia aquatilis]|uniref:Fimbrial protein n=1 Tax=Serratia aquatilis TaxID=1737515 RepID=A0ABV6EEU9_9GAMM
MKRNTLLVAIACALGTIAATPAFASNGNINFEGEVTTTTCLINGQNPNLGDVDVDVDLKQVEVSSLNFAGAVANATPFKITLGGNGDPDCTNGKMAKVHFEPNSPAIDSNTGWLKNIDASATPASNVEIQILNADDNQVIDLRDDSSVPSKMIVDNTAVYNYFGQYVAVNGPATAGKVASTVKYTIVYQ